MGLRRQGLLEARNEAVAKLEQSVTGLETEVAELKISAQRQAEELHSTQRAKDMLERDLADTQRQREEEVAWAAAAATELKAELASERQALAQQADELKQVCCVRI